MGVGIGVGIGVVVIIVIVVVVAETDLQRSIFFFRKAAPAHASRRNS